MSTVGHGHAWTESTKRRESGVTLVEGDVEPAVGMVK